MSEDAAGRIRVLLIEEDRLVRQALRMVLELEADLSVVGEAGDLACAPELARALEPDAIVTEILRPDSSTSTVIAELLQAAPRSAVVILSHFDEAPRRLQAAAMGVAAFIGKHEPYEALLAAIRSAAGRAQAPC